MIGVNIVLLELLESSLPYVYRNPMNPFGILFLLFLIVPLVEIYFLIQVGSAIGALPTVFLVVFTAVLGVLLLRYQGFVTLRNFQSNMGRGKLPALEILEGMVLLVAGALLLTPGFFTDAIGFACLIAPLRRAVIQWFLKQNRPRHRPPPASGKGPHT